MIDPFERARQIVASPASTSYPSQGASQEVRRILEIMLKRAEVYKAALEDISEDSYLCEHDLEFKPTAAAIKAQTALARKIGATPSHPSPVSGGNGQ